MKIVFSDKLPAEKKGRYAHFEHRKTGPDGWEFCDIREIVSRHQEDWCEELRTWHEELSRRAAALTPFWWLTAGSRLTAWYPTDLKPLFFALGLAEAAREEPDTPIIALACPQDVREYVEELSTGRRPKRLARTLQRIPTPHPLRLVASLAARILSRRLRTDPAESKHEVAVFSYTLRGDIFTAQDDHYFGDAFDALPGIDKDDILWVYYLDHLDDQRRVTKFLKAKGRRHAFYFDFLSLADIAGIRSSAFAVVHRLRPLEKDLPVLRIGSLESRIFPRRFYRDFIARRPPIIEISVFTAFENILRRTSARTVIYPYEEKGIERALLLACREADRGVRTVAYAHAVYNNGHFYLRRKAGGPRPPEPDLIATTSADSSSWLAPLAGRAAAKVPPLGSPRHPSDGGPPAPSDDFQNKLRVLFLAGYDYELGALADMLEQENGLFEDCELLIRRYPYGWSERQRRDTERIRALLPGVRVETRPLEEQIGWCDIALFASTSAGIHCMLRGRPVVHVDLHDIFAVDPLCGRDPGGTVERCRDAKTLRTALRRFRSMSPKEYLSAARRHAEMGAKIYAPLDRRRIAAELLAAKA